ncbi:MAG: fimbrillin family protein [Rikenellaceae bacterium]
MRRLITSLLVVAACVSCSKDSGAELSGSGDVGGSATTTTAKINISTKSESTTNGEDFEDGAAIGIRIEDTKTEGNVHTHDDNAHIKVVYSAAVEADTAAGVDASAAAWTFYTGSSYSTELRQISLEYIATSDDSGGTVDDTGATVDCNVYAYSPFNTAVTNFEAVPFTLTNMYDYMWASNPNFSLLQTNEKDVDLNFKHILARFRFNVEIQNPQSGVDLTYIWLTANNDTPQLVKSGTYSAKDGMISDTSQTTKSSPTISFDVDNVTFVHGEEAIRDIYVYPMVAATGDFTINFRFDSISVDNNYIIADGINIPAGDYAAGKSYTFNITFDNYAKIVLNDVIEEKWDDKTEKFEI